MKPIVLIACLILAAACREEQKLLTTTCTPKVDVVVETSATQKRNAAPSGARPDVVQVYWDVSRSMRDFAATGKATRGSETEPEAWTDDLTPVVNALDSRVLLSAHATAVEQYGVGAAIVPLGSAREALRPAADSTALHLAAEQIGTALATGSAQAAVVVSDLELETPPRSAAVSTVCGDVPLPSTPEAGTLFGRCFEHAVMAVDGPAATRNHLLVDVFRKHTHGRELFILLFATDRNFGRAISEGIVRRLDFTRHSIFDSGAVAAANVRGCRLTAPSPDVRFLSQGCAVKCFAREASVSAECDVRRAPNAWVYPAGRGLDGASYESLKKKAGGDAEEQAIVRFSIPCSAPSGRFNATVSFNWTERNPWANGDETFAPKANVRDLFDSLTDAIVRTVADRRLRIGVTLAK